MACLVNEAGPCLAGGEEPSLAEELPARTEHLIRPEVICVLNSEVGLVGPVVLVGCRKALSQCEQVLKPMGPLGSSLV
jgi:hypothetical protein